MTGTTSSRVFAPRVMTRRGGRFFSIPGQATRAGGPSPGSGKASGA
ncbi:hypothetical protein [Komagataeibacter europaeus]|nr:hypothetical protein [Komagataeibacter europaeus]